MYENQTVEAIKARILTSIDESQGLSSMAGGFADGVAGPVSEELSRVYQALNAVPSMLFVDDSSGGGTSTWWGSSTSISHGGAGQRHTAR